MPDMELIVAADRAGGIGRNGCLLYSIPEDLKRFKQLTMGKTLLMGRGTFFSLPGRRPLPGRINCVLSRNAAQLQSQFPAGENGPFFYASVEDFLAVHGQEQIMLIGGGEVYRLCQPLCRRAHVTRIDAEAEADTFFHLDGEWECIARESGCGGNPAYEFLTYARKAE